MFHKAINFIYDSSPLLAIAVLYSLYEDVRCETTTLPRHDGVDENGISEQQNSPSLKNVRSLHVPYTR